jgi:hypothetical protein
MQNAGCSICMKVCLVQRYGLSARGLCCPQAVPNTSFDAQPGVLRIGCVGWREATPTVPALPSVRTTTVSTTRIDPPANTYAYRAANGNRAISREFLIAIAT